MKSKLNLSDYLNRQRKCYEANEKYGLSLTDLFVDVESIQEEVYELEQAFYLKSPQYPLRVWAEPTLFLISEKQAKTQVRNI